MNDAAGFTHYRPEPLDTSGVTLTEELLQLIEVLAENVHDTWAATRLSMNWQYGIHHDSGNQLHPCLVPYADLQEDEKDIDRNVVVAIVGSILALGYEIRRLDPDGPTGNAEH
jgi:hypothetical protein